MSTLDKKGLGTTFTPLLDEHVDEPLFDLGHCALLGRLYYMGLQKDGTNKGAPINIAKLAKRYKMSRETATQKLNEAEKLGYVHIERTAGKKSHYTVYISPAHNPHLLEFSTGVVGKSRTRVAPEDLPEDLSSINANDPTGTFADALSFEEKDDSHITHSIGDELEIRGGFVPNTIHYPPAVTVVTDVPLAHVLEESTRKLEQRGLLDTSSKKIGEIRNSDDETLTSAEKTPKNGQYVAPDGTVWESLDAFFESIPPDAPDETAVQRVWTNDEGEIDYKRTPMPEIERLIVGWMKAHGSKISRLSAQSQNKLKSRLPNSNETLMMIGAELWKSPEVQKRLAGVANRPSVGHKTAFNQNEILGILMDEYQTWRKSRDLYQGNTEMLALTSALVEALGFKMDTIPANALIYLRDTVIPQLFAGGCRAHHAKPLIDGMKERKMGFIIGEWTARKKELDRTLATVSMEIIGGDDRIGSL